MTAWTKAPKKHKWFFELQYWAHVKIHCSKESISLRILPLVCVCGLTRFSERPDRARKKTRPALGKPAGLATHGLSGMPELVWLFLGLEGNVNHRPFPVGKLCQDGETMRFQEHTSKEICQARSSGFSPTKMWIFHLWLSYFFSYYLCYKKGIFTVQGLPTATLIWHKSASSALSFACDLQPKP